MVIEYELPYSTRRLDVLIFGQDDSSTDNIVLIELKQWSNDGVLDCPADGNVIVKYRHSHREQAHPSLQVQGYHFDLKGFVTAFSEAPEILLSSCVYCHNYSRSGSPSVLFLAKHSKSVETFPVFAKEDVASLGEYLKARLSRGNGQDVFRRFTTSPIRPSKRLLDHTKEMLNQRQIFNLIDDQIAAYNAIMQRVQSLSKTHQKSVVIVKGGPGTGKSVIVLEVMGELARQKKIVFHATGSSAFTNTLRKIMGVRGRPLFKFFNGFGKEEPGSIDVLICDEAHRIRHTSENRYTRKEHRTGELQIDELMRVAKLGVYFLDERKNVRPVEVGSVSLIKEAAARFGVTASEIAEFELKTQFRCSGSDQYLRWFDSVLGVGESGDLLFDPRMEFRIFSSPSEMMTKLGRETVRRKIPHASSLDFAGRGVLQIQTELS